MSLFSVNSNNQPNLHDQAQQAVGGSAQSIPNSLTSGMSHWYPYQGYSYPYYAPTPSYTFGIQKVANGYLVDFKGQKYVFASVLDMNKWLEAQDVK